MQDVKRTRPGLAWQRARDSKPRPPLPSGHGVMRELTREGPTHLMHESFRFAGSLNLTTLLHSAMTLITETLFVSPGFAHEVAPPPTPLRQVPRTAGVVRLMAQRGAPPPQDTVAARVRAVGQTSARSGSPPCGSQPAFDWVQACLREGLIRDQEDWPKRSHYLSRLEGWRVRGSEVCDDGLPGVTLGGASTIRT
jgi:hypothetical protein